MPSLLPGFQYDIFISYRQKDNKGDQWVTECAKALKTELESTFKEDISIYFDENPHDGLLETHNVDKSLEGKLKCLIFIPIISQTYCDPKSFAWQHEFCAFNQLAKEDQFGRDIKLSNGNVASRILPIKIHELSAEDKALLENELSGVIRAVEFIYKEPGVNRPLKPADHKNDNQNRTDYRNQVNKIANAIKEIVEGMKAAEAIANGAATEDTLTSKPKKTYVRKEIMRRSVLKASIVYLLIAVIFWKVTHISVSILRLSDSVLQLITMALIILFPIAMLMAWLYERSPQGFIRTDSVASRENPFSDAQKKPLTSNTLIILLMVTTAALFIVFQPTNSDRLNPNLGEIEKSIAVLPFDDMSPEGDQEHFSDGISEELINALAKMPNLKVTGRTSSFSYKGKNENLQVIGKELGVGTILEGSVRKSGNTLRITAQLINTNNGFHLWTGSYNRELTDVFKIQDEITEAILKELKIHLEDDRENVSRSSETNLDAYEIYMRARQKLAMRGKNLYDARDLFERVIELDPKYSPAYSGLGISLTLIPVYFPVPSEEFNELAKTSAQKAIELNPSNAEAYSVIGSVLAFYEWRWSEAEDYFERSYELNPNETEILNFLGDFYAYTRHPRAVEIETKALALDPLHPVKHGDLARAYIFQGNWEKAIEVDQNSLRLDSTLFPPFRDFVRAHCALGQFGEAEKLVDAYPISDKRTEIAMLELRVMIAIGRRELKSATEIAGKLEGAANNREFSPAQLGVLYVKFNMPEKATFWFEKAYQERDYHLISDYGITLPEDLPDHPALRKALDKPELNALFDLRRRNLKLREKVQGN